MYFLSLESVPNFWRAIPQFLGELPQFLRELHNFWRTAPMSEGTAPIMGELSQSQGEGGIENVPKGHRNSATRPKSLICSRKSSV